MLTFGGNGFIITLACAKAAKVVARRALESIESVMVGLDGERSGELDRERFQVVERYCIYHIIWDARIVLPVAPGLGGYGVEGSISVTTSRSTQRPLSIPLHFEVGCFEDVITRPIKVEYASSLQARRMHSLNVTVIRVSELLLQYARRQIFQRTEVCVRYRRASRCLLYTSPSPRDGLLSRMPSSA